MVRLRRPRPSERRRDPMLRLNVIVQNPAGASVVIWFGVVLVLVITLIVVLGVTLSLARARRDDDDDGSDPGLEAMRHRRLVVLRSRKSRGPQAVVVSELDPAGDSEPTSR
jgi:hypothetical protein